MLTVGKLIELLANYNQDMEIMSEQGLRFIHISSTNKGETILSTSKPIGICNRTNDYVFPSEVEGYSAYCPELDEDLYLFEFTPLDETDNN